MRHIVKQLQFFVIMSIVQFCAKYDFVLTSHAKSCENDDINFLFMRSFVQKKISCFREMRNFVQDCRLTLGRPDMLVSKFDFRKKFSSFRPKLSYFYQFINAVYHPAKTVWNNLFKKLYFPTYFLKTFY